MCVNNIISHGDVECKQLAFSINLSRKKEERKHTEVNLPKKYEVLQ